MTTLQATSSIVNSHNEWDLLEEVIVGRIDGATIPAWDESIRASMPTGHQEMYQKLGGKSFPLDRINAAAKELEILVSILEREGVTVTRPEPIDFTKDYKTPNWHSPGGLYNAMPRDILLIIGDEIIESPMAWRSRYFEIDGYRKLLKHYFKQGGRWTSAPKPQLVDELYNSGYTGTELENPVSYGITEFEPTFDAADFTRCGEDIFVQKSNVTNQFGIDWLRRHLGSKYRIHEMQVRDSHPMHIDATFVPLNAGTLLVNRERCPIIPEQFKDWTVIDAPKPTLPKTHTLYMSSNWLSVNTLMLDNKRIIIEEQEAYLEEVLLKYGFEVIKCPFRNFNSFGGSFHCATADVRRKGSLECYF